MTTVFRIATADGERRCTDSCYKAEGPDCECVCRGEFHGVGLQGAKERVAQRLADHPEELAPLFARRNEGTGMHQHEIRIGQRVRSLREFSGVPKGTEGVVDQFYPGGLMVAWDRPDRPLPPGYRQYDGRPAIQTGILRDGFDKAKELHFLEAVAR